MDTAEIKARAMAAAAELKATYADLKVAQGFKGFAMCAPYVVKHIESIGSNFAGPDKKALAIETILNLVPLPWWLPQPVAEALLNWLVERAVDEMKKLAAKF